VSCSSLKTERSSKTLIPGTCAPPCVESTPIGRTMSPAFVAHISQSGPIRYGDVPGSICVLESLDKFMPIGEAHCLTWDENGLTVWTLRIGKEEISGRWVIVDREFRPRSEPTSSDKSKSRPDTFLGSFWQGWSFGRLL